MMNLTGKILVAMPGMSDPRFNRAVIYVCAHDLKGAMGIMINQPMAGMNFSDLLDQVKLDEDQDLSPMVSHIPVFSGGPVQNSRGFMLHDSHYSQKDTVPVNDDYSVTGTVDVLKDIAVGEGPEKFLFALGYAGWDEGQLEDEIQQNAWLTVEPDPYLIFEAPVDEKWTLAFRQLGISPAMLSTAAGNA